MGSMLKARPTEYRGIVYESKCEAMFARWLELEAIEWSEIRKWRDSQDSPNTFGGGSSWGIVYHPQNLIVNGWPPDFLSWSCSVVGPTSIQCGGLQVPASSQDIIEYKPSKPTKTYLKTLLANFLELRQRIARYDPMLEGRTRFLLYYGSVFNEDRGFFELGYDELLLNDHDWLCDHEDAIRETRFNLENPK